MEANLFFKKIIPLALTIILAVSIYQTILAFVKGRPVKGVIKETILLCLFIGAAPGLVMIIPNIGESMVKPIESILDFLISAFS
jgi:hypothetical protein